MMTSFFSYFAFQGGVLDIPEIPADTDHIVAIAGWGETKDGVP